MSGGIGAQSLQPTALLIRKDIFELVAAHMDARVVIARDPKTSMFAVHYKKPILHSEVYRIAERHLRNHNYPNDRLPAANMAVLLSNVQKMGCYGFNVPAGPPALYGTCPGSVPGFPMLDAAEQDRVKLSAEAKVVGVNKPQWLCSGCYALKGRYPELTLSIAVETRRQAAVQLVSNGTFADEMERAIVQGQAKSVRLYKRLRSVGTFARAMYAVPNPAFFRIHDAGDFFSSRYLAAWVEVARRFQAPREHKGLKLPGVTFWAPTRTWAIERALGNKCPSNHDMTCLPSNLVVRPSSLNFGDHAPRLGHGFANGSAAGNVDQWTSIASWQCPAYLPPELGGGAELKEGKWVQGCCARSEGPGAQTGNRGDMRAPRGHGCRVCWLDPNTSVAYQEH